MRNYRQTAIASITAVSMVILMLNAKEASAFAADALKLCTASLIPSLFPFMFLAIVLNGTLSGCRFRFLRIVRSVCRIPEGSEMLFLLGILGGYPVGAQVIANAYQGGNLKKEDAQRMLGFCNNAGPSFIFGVIGPLFHSVTVPALLWLIQVISALITGAVLKGNCDTAIKENRRTHVSITDALEKSVKAMGLICGWVILFRIIVGFLERFLGTYISGNILTVITGLLELTNGCIALYGVKNSGLRFILASTFLSLGGMCVLLQTASSIKTLNIKTYISGKCIQGIVSAILAYIIQHFIFSPENRYISPHILLLSVFFLILSAIICINRKKTVAFQKKVVYN